MKTPDFHSLGCLAQNLIAFLDRSTHKKEAEVRDNCELALVAIYKIAEENNWEDLMRTIAATGIDLHS